MPNTELLLTLKEWAREEQDKKDAGLPSEWDQGFWLTGTACGTACCLAGKAALLSGYRVYEKVPVGYIDSWVIRLGRFAGKEHIRDVAERLLDLDERTASRLFNGNNTYKDVEQVIDAILAGTFDPETWKSAWELAQLARMAQEGAE